MMGYFELVIILCTVINALWVNTDATVTLSDFDYMLCGLDNSTCVPVDQYESINNGIFEPSEWPSGPYALITPDVGCPESVLSGWRRGYLSFTWKQPHSLTSVSYCDYCDYFTENLKHDNHVKTDCTNQTENCTSICSPTLHSNKRSGHEVLLGPFSAYDWRLNFCFKIKDESIYMKEQTWPNAHYSIFGDGDKCPIGFAPSKRSIKLPAITSWISYGHLPGFSISEHEDGTATLTLNTCDCKTLGDENDFFNVSSTFMLLKIKNDFSCPNMSFADVTTEALQLERQNEYNVEVMKIFELCYFKLNTKQQASQNYLLMPQNKMPNEVKTVYSISNPTLIFGNSTSHIGSKSPVQAKNKPLWTQIYEIKMIPWLLIDIGRNFAVTGLQINNYYLPEVNSHEFLGSLNTDLNGLPCQRWDSQTPHEHSMTNDDQFPDMTVSDAENYCRDPSGSGYIWCYIDSPYLRWQICANSVYSLKKTEKPFTTCFVSETRWRFDDFEGVRCEYTSHFENGLFYSKFQRHLEGRYIKLLHDEVDMPTFYKATKDIKVLTTEYFAYGRRRCNNDLGMGDESILDHQITGSSCLSHSPPASSRPFSSGWCAGTSDSNPHITVDMTIDTMIEGITIYNWEFIDQVIEDGIFRKKYFPIGSKAVMLRYRNANNETILNKNYSVITSLPINEPQTFHHQQVIARYITIYIIETMYPHSKCLRFELHGCKMTSRPHLVAVERHMNYLEKDEPETITNMKILNVPSSLTSINFPLQYPGGEMYTWRIVSVFDKYIQLLFTNISFNIYDVSPWSNCQDKITLHSENVKDGFAMNEDFNGMMTMLEMDSSIITLTFSSCRPMTKIKRNGCGFKAITNHKAIPTCFSGRISDDNIISNRCNQQSMFLSSVSRLNFPDIFVSEEWTVNVKRHSIHLHVIYFNVKCDAESLFKITDRFSGGKTYCNTDRISRDWYSDSDTLHIRLKTSRSLDDSNNQRASKEGFKAMYSTVKQSMSHLIDFKKIFYQAVKYFWTIDVFIESISQIIKLEREWDNSWKNATLLMYQACSEKFGKCYELFTGAITTWETAGQECWIRQSRLVSIHSKEEHELLNYILRNFKYVDLQDETVESAFASDIEDPNYYTHIGLSRVVGRFGLNTHLWEDSSETTYSAWKIDEPSSENDCTRMSFHLHNTMNTWESTNCHTGLANYFICENNLLKEISESTVSYLYNGTLNTTQKGFDCQRWDLQHPNTHSYVKNEMFPDSDIHAAENFCRDPGRDGYIWCYTMHPGTRYDKCITEGKRELPSLHYTGQLSKTSSGRTCQRWDRQTPHSHEYKYLSFYPDNTFDDVGNHCRDPSYSGVLWCYTTDIWRRWDQCNIKDTASDRCFKTLSKYTGQQNTTLSGLDCQSWAEIVPHDHEKFFDAQFPDQSVSAASNFCRDPYDNGYLWCFTTDPAKRWEPCLFDYKYQVSNFTSRGDLIGDKQLSCLNGDYLSREDICDGIPDCSDVSDETGCTYTEQILLLNQEISANPTDLLYNYSIFKCKSDERISMLSKCNAVIDCIDGSDEVNCSYGGENCLEGEFKCGDGMCIHLSQMCDHVVDCWDGLDENCDFPVCSQTEFRCLNQQCIPASDRCNAYRNCFDGTDEESCDVCEENAFHCDLTRCIPKRVVCDKYVDCKDGSDEHYCHEPVYMSCEDWWNAGYKTTGLYRLNKTEVVCDFSLVKEHKKIYTIFNNYKVVTRFGAEYIEFDNIEVLKRTHFLNESYTCIQNIKQSCLPVFETFAEWNGTNKSCVSHTLKVYPYRMESVNRTFNYSTDNIFVMDQDIDLIQFEYSETDSSQMIHSFLEIGTEITVGYVNCSYEILEVPSDPMNCVFDIDSAGFTYGRKFGSYYEDCEDFECPKNTVRCPHAFCLPLKFVCDGNKQCPGGQDEHGCGCDDREREVILLHEGKEESGLIQSIASQLYTDKGIIRELRIKSSRKQYDLEFDHLILDISDTVLRPHSVYNREFTCNYTILASHFINRIEFTKLSSRGIIYIQSDNESEILAKMMFGKIRSQPDFHIYRVMKSIYNKTDQMIKKYPFVHNIAVKYFKSLARLGSRYFPGVCKEAATVICANIYKCSASKTCIPLEQVCDGVTQCPHGDDERVCYYSCPENCTCYEYTTECAANNANNDILAFIHTNTRSLDLNGNANLQNILLKPISKFPLLIKLNISNCSIKHMMGNVFNSMLNLRKLDLGFNKLLTIPTAAFVGLRKLTFLNLLGNTEILTFDSNAMIGLLSLKTLEIKGANIKKISSRTFAGLRLDILLISGNNITEIEDGAFLGMFTKVLDMEANKIEVFDKGLFRGVSGIILLHTPAYKFCCIRPNYLSDDNCFPERDEFSSCDDLLRLSALQTMLWLIGLVALFGNILSVIYRLVYDRERLKLGFGIFVTNLAVADFMMGIYLIIIAVADATYRKRYIFMDEYWRNSSWCTLAGILSTISSEASVFFLCLITLDRFLVIKYPFGQVRFKTRSAGIASSVAWFISVTIGIIPLIFKDIFEDKFYSKSGVCIALPLTKDRPPGWLYSVVIFICLNFVTFCLIAFGQVIIYMEIKKATSGIRRSSTRRGKSGTGRRKELAVARNLFLVVSTDFLCWFPIGCMGLMAMSGHVIPGEVYAWTAVFILPINSALNPVLYTLTALLAKKKSKAQQDERTCSTFHSVRRVNKSGLLNGVFRYFITKEGNRSQDYMSLRDIYDKNIKASTKDVLKCFRNLSHCLGLLHKNSLVVELDDRFVYVNVENNAMTGDVQIRHEPSVCRTEEMKRENIHQLGQVARRLLTYVMKLKE